MPLTDDPPATKGQCTTIVGWANPHRQVDAMKGWIQGQPWQTTAIWVGHTLRTNGAHAKYGRGTHLAWTVQPPRRRAHPLPARQPMSPHSDDGRAAVVNRRATRHRGDLTMNQPRTSRQM